MLNGKVSQSVEEKLERLRDAVIKEFGFAADTVSTTFHPKMPTNHEPTDFIYLQVSRTPENFSDANYSRVQTFAAGKLNGLWLGKHPLVALKMDLPQKPKDAAPQPSPHA